MNLRPERVPPIRFRLGRKPFRPRLGRVFAGLLLFGFFFVWFPGVWCGRHAGDWWIGDGERAKGLARTVGRWTEQTLGYEHFKTGDPLFDGEWLFGTYQMAVLGLGQIALEHPEMRADCLRWMERCEERLMDVPVRRFDAEAWGRDPLAALETDEGHVAYLGYLNLALSLHRSIDPTFKHREWNDRISAALARNLAGSPIRLLETYPGMTFPVDNTAALASLRLLDLADGTNRYGELYGQWVQAMRSRYIDPETGLLFQRVDPIRGHPIDAPRGSGTLLSAYFLGLCREPLSAELYAAAKKQLWAPALGFGAAREYTQEHSAGQGDIDSGPLLLGRSISASGFMLAGARQHGDEATFRSLYRSVHLFGAPVRTEVGLSFVSGGPLGNAMMLALLTARPMAPEAKP